MAMHLDRLSILDASFLAHEDRGTHMHIGWVMIAAGPPPSLDDFVAHVRSRLHLAPRFRQKLWYPPLQLGRPFWVDDPRFNLEYHVRHTGLPSGNSMNHLRRLTGRIFSQGLDRSKPLWEMWLVQGLEDDRFAIITKTHHAMVDGVAGVDLNTVLFDATPHPQHMDTLPAPRVWLAHPEPNAPQMLAAGVRDAVSVPLALGRQLVDLWNDPESAVLLAQQVAQGVGDFISAMLNPPSPTPLNVPLSSHRRVWWGECKLADMKKIKDAFGGTINDVYLAAVTGALARWLRTRGVSTKNLQLRAAIPISLRTNDEQGELGNRIVECFAPLPVHINDPVERLRTVKRALEGLKQSKQALGAQTISTVQRFAPPALLAQASRLNFSTRLFNLLATNVPGPQQPLYLIGREVERIGPVGFLVENSALSVVVASYNGKLEFGLLCDPDVLGELDEIGGYLEDSIAELLAAARRQRGKPKKKPVAAATRRREK